MNDGGAIILTGSVISVLGSWAASKAGARAKARVTSCEPSARNIRVNVVAPLRQLIGPGCDPDSRITSVRSVKRFTGKRVLSLPKLNHVDAVSQKYKVRLRQRDCYPLAEYCHSPRRVEPLLQSQRHFIGRGIL